MTHYDPKDHTLLERVEELEGFAAEMLKKIERLFIDVPTIQGDARRLQDSCAGWMDRLTKRLDTTDNDVAITIRSMADLAERISGLEKLILESTHTHGPGQ